MLDLSRSVADLRDRQLLWQRKRLEDKVLVLQKRRLSYTTGTARARRLDDDLAHYGSHLAECVGEILARGLDTQDSYPALFKPSILRRSPRKEV